MILWVLLMFVLVFVLGLAFYMWLSHMGTRDIDELMKEIRASQETQDSIWKTRHSVTSIRFAPTDKLDALGGSVDDFMRKCVLGEADFLITDWSSLSEFDVDDESVIAKVQNRYGVDVRAHMDKRIVDIVEFIEREQK